VKVIVHFQASKLKEKTLWINAVSVTKTEVYTILRDVCIVSNRLTYIDSKLSEMEILAQPLCETVFTPTTFRHTKRLPIRISTPPPPIKSFTSKIAPDVGGVAWHFQFEFVTSQMWIVSQREQSLQGTVFCDVKNFKHPY
jgi:hypothetical protein